MGGEYDMKNRRSVYIAIAIMLISIPLFVYARTYTEREKEILEETGGEMKSDTRILNTDGIEFTEEYTFYDYYLETRTEEERRQREAKRVDLSDNESLERAKYRPTIYDEEPKNDYEREYFPVAKEKKIVALEFGQLENLLNEEKNLDKCIQYQNEMDLLLEKFCRLGEEMKAIQEKYGIEDD